ncbi:hypothetical protein D9Q98_009037 [Chlorella vulgaris]|uniref:Uncharacterized protein n=1 Tax=Chlorella vulgaris TaxID=3077 RepID=A0A9D4TH54_CHLVU|nr:hypothetical protein D9Q98_009037 [Chlorella vulgaris]
MQQVAALPSQGRCGAWAAGKASCQRQQPRAPRGSRLSVRAFGTNGTSTGLDLSKQTTSAPPAGDMLEMVVADDLRPRGGATAARRPSRRLVPAPHKLPHPNGNGSGPAETTNGRRSSAGSSNGSGTQLPAAAVEQLLAQQAASRAVTAQLGLAQRQAMEQSLELKETRQELSNREAEVVSLKHQLAERDGKLKAARTDALEARMALQQKDVELKAAFAQLSEAVHDRSVMRTQLAQTHAELAETRAELEQLADDILAIKELMEDEDEELGLSDNSDSESYTYYSPAAAEEQYAAAEPPPAAFGDGDEALDILQSLASLSRQLVEDATEDDAILDSMAQSWSAAPRPEA